MASIYFTTHCTECSGDAPKFVDCDACSRRVFHGLPEYVGQQCACGCLDRIEDGAERIEVDGKVYVPWHYVSVQRELAGVERFDDADACEAEVAKLRAAWRERQREVTRAMDGNFAQMSATGGV